jgi:hypothetical protein
MIAELANHWDFSSKCFGDLGTNNLPAPIAYARDQCQYCDFPDVPDSGRNGR